MYTGLLHTLVTMRRPVGAIGIMGAPILREIIAESLTEKRPTGVGTARSPSYRTMLARLDIYKGDPMAPLAGVGELRSCVEWANATREDEHEYLTAEEVMERYRGAVEL